MAINTNDPTAWPFPNHAMNVRGTDTTTGPARISIVYPRTKFTFVVEFFINPKALLPNRMQTNLTEFLNNGRLFASLRSIDHPQTTMTIQKLRSYNKNVIIPTRMEYAQSAMGFHDDNSSMVTALWREYRAYYQHEGTLGTTSVRNNNINESGVNEFRSHNDLVGPDVRAEQQTRPSLGMTLRANDGRHFFDAIRVYDLGADPDSVNVYTYLNPVIVSMAHEGLNYEDRVGLVGINFTFDYEGYYHLTGLNNNQFQDAIRHQLNSIGGITASRVDGHATMDQLSQPDPYDPDIGTGFSVGNISSILDSLEGVRGTINDLSFNNVIPSPIAPSSIISSTTLPPYISASEWQNIRERTKGTPF